MQSWKVIVIIIVAVVVLVYPLFVVSGRCSREEEQRDDFKERKED